MFLCLSLMMGKLTLILEPTTLNLELLDIHFDILCVSKSDTSHAGTSSP